LLILKSERKVDKVLSHRSALALALVGNFLLPAPSLRVRVGSDWVTWWRSDTAPRSWLNADPTLLSGIRWRVVRDGMEIGALRISGRGGAERLRVLLIRFEPRRFRYSLEERKTDRHHASWAVDSMPAAATLAFNVGQFQGTTQWGWLVTGGIERQQMSQAPLATAVVFDSSSGMHMVAAGDTERAGKLAVAVGFQSYPTLLVKGEIPSLLREAGRGVDLSHRDSRLALGALRDGRVLVALTRFDGLNGELEELPVGLTVPEMAALMGALGCEDAVMLDGGISGQLAVRDAHGAMMMSRGWRKVPLGFVVTPK